MTEAPRSVSAWLAKAEHDLGSAELLAQAPDPYWDVIVFLAQQSAEKFSKALLVTNGRRPPKTHDLVELLNGVLDHTPELESFRQDFAFLSPLAVVARYPGYDATDPKADGLRGLAIARRVKVAIRRLIVPPSAEHA